MAAGESFVRELILAPSERVMCRLSRMLVTSPSVPSTMARLIMAGLALNRCEYPMVNFRLRVVGERDELVGLVERERDRLLQKHVLAGFQRSLGHWVVKMLRSGRDDDGVDAKVLDDVFPVGRSYPPGWSAR